MLGIVRTLKKSREIFNEALTQQDDLLVSSGSELV